jgi:hypothetical protein
VPLSLHTSTPANEQNRIIFPQGDVPKKKSMLIESAQADRTRAKMRWWQELIKWRQLKKQQKEFDKDKERTCDDPRYQYALELDSKDMRETNLFFGRDDLPKTIADIERVNKKASSGASERWYSEFLFRTEVTESGKKDSRKQFFLFEEYIAYMVYRYPKPVHVKPAPDGSKGLCELALEKSSGYTAAQDKDEAREERAEEEEREKVAEAVTKSVGADELRSDIRKVRRQFQSDGTKEATFDILKAQVDKLQSNMELLIDHLKPGEKRDNQDEQEGRNKDKDKDV